MTSNQNSVFILLKLGGYYFLDFYLEDFLERQCT
jgi:hypothetical protein